MPYIIVGMRGMA